MGDLHRLGLANAETDKDSQKNVSNISAGNTTNSKPIPA